MTFKTLLGACAACITFSGAAQANIEYFCGQDDLGITYTLTVFDEENVAEVRGVTLNGDQSSALLRPEFRGSETVFISDTRNSEFVELEENNGELTLQGRRYGCEVTAITVPGGEVAGFPPQDAPLPNGAFYGISLGGNLRAGPGMNFADVGSTFEGMEIIMVQNSGVFMNGYPWWLVQSTDGVQSYQWGGLLCVPGRPTQGLYQC